MTRSAIAFITSLLLFAGCSSNTDMDETAEGGAQDPAAAQTPQADNPAVQQDISALEAELAAKNYEAAFNKIQVLKEIPKSEAEAAQFRAVLSQASDQLYQQAQTDPQAMQRYQQLSRIQMGR